VIDGSLRKLVRVHLPMVHWQSIETGGTGRGVPDSNGCFRGTEFWVEFKQTTGWQVTVRPEQIAWLHRRARAGGRTFILLRRKCTPGPRRAASDEVYLIRGDYAEEIQRLSLRTAPAGAVLGHWPGGPTLWPWMKILGMLVQ
jgi:hypothetical protein